MSRTFWGVAIFLASVKEGSVPITGESWADEN
jgi:hypothetical protein